jgi:hypothetical protein
MKSFFIISIIFIFCVSSSFAQGWRFASVGKCPGASTEGGLVEADTLGNVYASTWLWQNSTTPVSPLIAIFGTDTVEDVSGIGFKSVIVCTDSLGNYKWVLPMLNGRTSILDLEADNRGNVYVLGHCNGSSFDFGGFFVSSPSSSFYFCAKVSSAGVVAWVKDFPSGVLPRSIKINSSGMMYFGGYYGTSAVLGGSTLATPSGGGDVFIAKSDAELNYLWARGYQGNGPYDEIYELALTDDSMIYMLGGYTSDSISFGASTIYNPTSGVKTYFFIAKTDKDGNPMWAQEIAADTFSTRAVSCSADPEGNVYIGGYYVNNLALDTITLPYSFGRPRMFVAKYDMSGGVRWAKTIEDNTMFSRCQLEGDDCDDLWICGQGGHSIGLPSNPMYLAHFDTAGNLIDTVFINTGGDDGSSLAVDNKGSVYVVSDASVCSIKLGFDSVVVTDGVSQVFFVGAYRYNLPGCVPDTLPPVDHHTSVTNVNNDLKELLVYPNPASDEITISTNNAFIDARLDIISLGGHVMGTYMLNGLTPHVSIKDLPSGVHICRIYTSNQTHVFKILKE